MIAKTTIIAILMFSASNSVCAEPNKLKNACFEQAANRYHIPVKLLKAISTVESGGNASALHRNPSGSFDIGHMQINSSWLPTLAKYGITQANLLNPCVNTHVGAWILANNFRQVGYNWKAVGAYNAKSPDKADVYAHKVSAHMYAQSKGDAID